jgi:hypothetical protein
VASFSTSRLPRSRTSDWRAPMRLKAIPRMLVGAYEDFLELWKGADTDIPLFRKPRPSTQG